MPPSFLKKDEGLFLFKEFNFAGCNSFIDHVEELCGSAGKVEDSSSNIWTPVLNGDNNAFFVVYAG